MHTLLTAPYALAYGMNHCLNVVSERAGRPASVLIRAIELLEGTDEMRASRVRSAHHQPTDRVRDVRLAAGPGLLDASSPSLSTRLP